MARASKHIKLPLISAIENRDFDTFLSIWAVEKMSMDEKAVQTFLYQAFCHRIELKNWSFYKAVLNEVVKTGVSLNFHIDDSCGSFVALLINTYSIDVIEFLIENGGDINFVADNQYFELESDKIQPYYDSFTAFSRYLTCLDYANLLLQDMLCLENQYEKWASSIGDFSHSELSNNKETIEITKAEYCQLQDMARRYYHRSELYGLINYLKNNGGKTSLEIAK